MRLAAQAKLGFYPIAPLAVDLLARHLRLPEKRADETRILDPCLGKGLAVQRLANSLGVTEDRVYGVELHHDRVEEARAIMPLAHIVGPADYLATRVTPHSFGLIYANPPFDHEIGGGKREEQKFAERAHWQLVPNGILALVMPVNRWLGNEKLVHFIDSHFHEVRIYRLPDAIRKFREIVIFAVKRNITLPKESVQIHGRLVREGWGRTWDQPRESDLAVLGERSPTITTTKSDRPWKPDAVSLGPLEPEVHSYEIPRSFHPRVFAKSKMTEAELAEALRESPLNRILAATPARTMDRPPLPPGKGHISQMLAAGMLDGVVPCDEPHVVRGTAKKIAYLNQEACATTSNADGSTTIKKVYSESVDLVIRTIDRLGVIRTLEAAKDDEPDTEPDPPKETESATVALPVRSVTTTEPNEDEDEDETLRPEPGEVVVARNDSLEVSGSKRDLFDARRSYKVVEVACAHPNGVSWRQVYSDWEDAGDDRFAMLQDAKREAMRLNQIHAGNTRAHHFFVMGTDDDPAGHSSFTPSQETSHERP